VYATVHLAACDGSWVSSLIASEFISDISIGSKAIEGRVIDNLKVPTENIPDIEQWPSQDDAPLFGFRERVMSLCKTASPAPRNLLIPMSGNDSLAISIVTGSVVRHGVNVEAWTSAATMLKLPKIRQGEQVFVNGIPLFDYSFPGAKVVQRESFNCLARTSGGISLISYDDGGNASSISEVDRKNIKHTLVVPGSVGEAALDLICKVF
jgi:hypothetical protein